MLVTIERGSPAWRELAEIIAAPETRKVSIEIRADGLAVKCNELMWSPSMRTKEEK